MAMIIFEVSYSSQAIDIYIVCVMVPINTGSRSQLRLYPNKMYTFTLSIYKVMFVSVAEWLRRQTRNLLGSPAQVRILSLTIFFCKPYPLSYSSEIGAFQ